MNPKSLDMQIEEFLNRDPSEIMEYEKTRFDQLAGEFNETLVIYGAGNLGKKSLRGLRKVGIEPLAFCDADSDLWGASIEDLKVLAPEEAARKYGQNAAFVVAVWSPGEKRQISYIKGGLVKLNCLIVTSFLPLFWKYPQIFLPHFRLDLPHKVYKQKEDVKKAFSLMSDQISRRLYLDHLKLFLDEEYEVQSATLTEGAYFSTGLFDLSSEEVFVDCGAFDGDTIRDYLAKLRTSFRRIIAFEPDPKSFARLQDYVLALQDDIRKKIVLYNSCVGRTHGTVRFHSAGFWSCVRDDGSLDVDSVALDQLLADTGATYIKMDVEGAELDALVGGRNTIHENHPILGICAYHRQDHLWRLPLLIKSIISGRYHFFLRHYGQFGFGDTISYAVPDHRVKLQYMRCS